MDENSALGFVLVVLGAVSLSQWTVPLSHMTAHTNWQWMNAFLVYAPASVAYSTLFALGVTNGELGSVLRNVDPEPIIAVFFLGLCFGCGNTMMGFVVPRLGVSMSSTLNPSMFLVSGTLLPALIFDSSEFATAGGALTIVSMIAALAGMLLALRANNLRALAIAQRSGAGIVAKDRRAVIVYAAAAIGGGFLASLMNLGWRIGQRPILASALLVAGTPDFLSGIVSWTLALWAACIPAVVVPLFVLLRQPHSTAVVVAGKTMPGAPKEDGDVSFHSARSGSGSDSDSDSFDSAETSASVPGAAAHSGSMLSPTRRLQQVMLSRAVWRNYMFAMLMALLQVSGFFLFSVGSTLLGDLGTSAGWGVFSCVSILTANLAGVIQGDWRNAGKAAVWHMVLAISLLLLAIALLVGSFFI